MSETLKLGPHDSLEIVSSTPEALEVEASYRPGGSPPPAHFHPAQDERFEVLDGAMRARVDGEERELADGRRDRDRPRPGAPDVEPRRGAGPGALGDHPRRAHRGVVPDPRRALPRGRATSPRGARSTSPPCSRSTTTSSGSTGERRAGAGPGRALRQLPPPAARAQHPRLGLLALPALADRPRLPALPAGSGHRLPRPRAARPGRGR